ncbi:MAG TPA: tetratricopeptide repeat protein [Acidobacteriaceae bacterium]|nr:tetratricopeptide repeat protein [Acidobacteriaceae bacterium]
MKLAKRDAAEELYYRAVDAMADAHLKTATDLFRAALAEDETFLDAWHGLIRTLQDCGQLEEALQVALRLAAMQPEDVLVHTRLSILYQMQGKIAEAEAESAKARVLGWKLELQSKSKPMAEGSF